MRHGSSPPRSSKPSHACVVRFPHGMAGDSIESSSIADPVGGWPGAGGSRGKMVASRCDSIRHLGCMSDASLGVPVSPDRYSWRPLIHEFLFLRVLVESWSGDMGSCENPPRCARVVGVIRSAWMDVVIGDALTG